MRAGFRSCPLALCGGLYYTIHIDDRPMTFTDECAREAMIDSQFRAADDYENYLDLVAQINNEVKDEKHTWIFI